MSSLKAAFTSAYSNAAGGCSNCSVNLALANPAPTMSGASSFDVLAPPGGTFDLFPEIASQGQGPSFAPPPSASCNNGQPGPQLNAQNPAVSCVFLYFAARNADTCQSASSTDYCNVDNSVTDEGYGFPYGPALGGSFVMVMDPASYAVSIVPTVTSFQGATPVGGNGSGNATVSGSIQAPAWPPTTAPATASRNVHE